MKKIKGLRWWIIGLIGLATIINYIDRSTLNLMWPSISKDLGMNKEDYAIILNVFMVAYAIGQLVSGKFFDKVGTRIGYVITIAVWGVSSFMHSFARGIITFGFFRSTLGLSEAGNWPGAVKSNAEWFPIKERAIAQGIFNAGASIGSVIAPPLIATLWAAFGSKKKREIRTAHDSLKDKISFMLSAFRLGFFLSSALCPSRINFLSSSVSQGCSAGNFLLIISQGITQMIPNDPTIIKVIFQPKAAHKVAIKGGAITDPIEAPALNIP